MKVSIIVGGFQKCGTTALHGFLSNHPKLIPSNSKELDFFNYDQNYQLGIKYYHSFFSKRYMFSKYRGYKYFESSPSYLNDKNPSITAERIRNYNQEMKVIVLIRNPILRAYSAWNMYRNRFFEGNVDWWVDWIKEREGFYPTVLRRDKYEYDDFEFFIRNEVDSLNGNLLIECPILSAGFYYKGIQSYKEKFGENILVLKNEDLNTNTAATLLKIEKFLQIEPFDWSHYENVKIFKGEYRDEITSRTYDYLKSFYLDSDQKVFELTGLSYFK